MAAGAGGAAAVSTKVVAVLDAGADDVLRAPYDADELLARVRSLARRPMHRRPTILQVADLTLDPAQHWSVEVRRTSNCNLESSPSWPS